MKDYCRVERKVPPKHRTNRYGSYVWTTTLKLWGERDLTSLCSGPIRSCGQLPGLDQPPPGQLRRALLEAPIPGLHLVHSGSRTRLLHQTTACIHISRVILTAFERLPSMWDDEDNSILSPAFHLLVLPHLTHYPLQIPMAPSSAATPRHPK